MYGAVPHNLLAATALASEGGAVSFCLCGSLVVFHTDVLCGAECAVFVVSTVFYIAADGLHLRFVRHCLDTPVV